MNEADLIKNALPEEAQSEHIVEREALETAARALVRHSYTAADLITRAPLSCRPETTVAEAARIMRDANASSLGITELHSDKLLGIVTIRDLSSRVLAEGLSPNSLVHQVMSKEVITLPSTALGSDILALMLKRKIGHLPVVDAGRFCGMVTQTDLIRVEAISAAALVRQISNAGDVAGMAAVTARIPELLMQLIGSRQRHEVVTRLITDIADAVTRRLVSMAETSLGPAPVPYLWLACGSQGRQEQTGQTDQDNCLFLDDSVTPGDMPYFERLANIVSDGLDACGYVYCPGDMMATNPRWRQPLKVWRASFRSWTNEPSPEAQMLASVMFDLRPICGTVSLHEDLQAETLDTASRNSIFVAHMIANSLKRRPAIGVLRRFATVRSGKYRDHIDTKLNGVIPVTDLARVYALQGSLTQVNTRARLEAAEKAGIISVSGARDLIEAYDLIATLRLEHQAKCVKSGQQPNNYLNPQHLSDFQRNHLRSAFVVVRGMQSAAGQGKSALT